MDVGLIGLGAMGSRMARNLLGAGHSLHIYGRRADAVEPLVAAGALACPSPASVSAASDVVISMVTTTSDVEQILLSDGGVVDGAAPGTVVVDMSSISAAATRRIAAELASRGVHMLDAPVSGGPAGAEDGTLAIMVGGDIAIFERVRPLFECLGTMVVHMGPIGAGQLTKSCNQLALLLAAEGVAEALALAARCGLSLGQVRRTMLGGYAASRVLELFGDRMVERQFEAGIPVRLYHKDLAIVLQLAHELSLKVPAAAVVMEHLNGLVQTGSGEKDLAALFQWLES